MQLPAVQPLQFQGITTTFARAGEHHRSLHLFRSTKELATRLTFATELSVTPDELVHQVKRPTISTSPPATRRQTTRLLLALRPSRRYDTLVLLFVASFFRALFGFSPCIITTLAFEVLQIDICLCVIISTYLETIVEGRTPQCQTHGSPLPGAAYIRLTPCMLETEHGTQSATPSCCPT